MKKILLTSIAAFMVCFAAHSQIVITEIMYNPPEAGTDSLEYIELRNISAATVDMSGWNFTQGVEYVFPTGATMTAGQYVVIAKVATLFNTRFGFTPLEWVMGGALSNPGEDIELRDAAGNVIDYVDYKPTLPWPVNGAGAGASISLCDPTADNTLPTSWVACPTSAGFNVNGLAVFADPGAATTCSSDVDAVTDNALSISPLPVIINVLLNDYQPLPITAVTIEQAPAQGSAVVNANKTITYTPTATQCGPTSFFYKACAGANCDTAKVNVNVRCYPVRTIAQVSGLNALGVVDSVGVACELTGTVLGVNLRAANGLQFTIIDGNSGIAVFRQLGSVGYLVTEKDRIKVKGVITQFNGLNEIVVDTIHFVSSNNALPTPIVTPVPSEQYESRLITINNLVLVDTATWTTGMGANGFITKAVNPSSDTTVIRIDNDVTLYTEPDPLFPFNLTGIGTQNDNSNPYTSGYQITPRYLADLDLIVGTNEPLEAILKLTPNPAQQELIFTSDIDIERIRVYDAYGKLTIQQELGTANAHINISTLSSGFYVLVAEKAGKLKAVKFVKL